MAALRFWDWLLGAAPVRSWTDQIQVLRHDTALTDRLPKVQPPTITKTPRPVEAAHVLRPDFRREMRRELFSKKKA